MRKIKYVVINDEITISYNEFLVLKANFSKYKDSKEPSDINSFTTKGIVYDLIFNKTEHNKEYINHDTFLNIMQEFKHEYFESSFRYRGFEDILDIIEIKDEKELRKYKLEELFKDE
jgi:hypothetical protein